MEEKDRILKEKDPTYCTGSTFPMKKRRGLWAAVLIPVILVSGFAGLLAGLRIRLFDGGSREETVQFTNQEDLEDVLSRGDAEDSVASKSYALGFTGEDVSSLWQNYYDLPEGVFITQVERPETGLARGDILLFLNDTRITGVESLTAILATCDPEAPLEFVIYRNGGRQELTLEEQQ